MGGVTGGPGPRRRARAGRASDPCHQQSPGGRGAEQAPHSVPEGKGWASLGPSRSPAQREGAGGGGSVYHSPARHWGPTALHGPGSVMNETLTQRPILALCGWGSRADPQAGLGGGEGPEEGRARRRGHSSGLPEPCRERGGGGGWGGHGHPAPGTTPTRSRGHRALPGPPGSSQRAAELWHPQNQGSCRVAGPPAARAGSRGLARCPPRLCRAHRGAHAPAPPVK